MKIRFEQVPGLRLIPHFEGDFDPCSCGVPWVSDEETLFTIFGHDSRSNQTNVIDPKGNTTITVFDGANRT